MKTVYLHIGMPKTATTSLQIFLEANANILKKHGYIYPKIDVQYWYANKRRNAHFLMENFSTKKDVQKEEKYQDDMNTGMMAIMSAIKKADNVVLSDEGLWNANGRKRIFQLFKERLNDEDIKLKIIIYLRRQDLFVNSFWNQKIKENRFNYTQEEYMNKRVPRLKLNYIQYLDELSDIVGMENVITRVFEREQFTGNEKSIYSDFLDAIGLEKTEDFKDLPVEANESLNGNFLEIRRRLNLITGEVDEKTKDFNRIVLNGIKNASNDEKGKPEFFSLEERIEFLNKFEETNKKAAEKYLNRKDGRLFYNMNYPKTEKWNMDYKELFEDSLRLICTMANEQTEIKKELDKVKTMKQNRMFQGIGFLKKAF